MILIHGPDDASLIAARLLSPVRVEIARTWAEFEAGAGDACLLVTIAPWLGDGLACAQLCALRRRVGERPLVVVTRKDADNVRRLGAIAIEEIVWLHEIERDLAAAVQRARGRASQRRAAMELVRAHHLPGRLRSALSGALDREPPLRTVAELAALAHCDRRTLWHHWHRAAPVGSATRPQDFVDWLLLLCAVRHKRPDRNWSAAAECAGIHLHTLSRTARRLLGIGLSELELLGDAGVMVEFEARVLTPLMSNGAEIGRSAVVRPGFPRHRAVASGVTGTPLRHLSAEDVMHKDLMALDERELRSVVGGIDQNGSGISWALGYSLGWIVYQVETANQGMAQLSTMGGSIGGG